MSQYICPKCKQQSFNWTAEGEPYEITIWYCHSCGYDATEDERLGCEDCPGCGQKYLTILKDYEKEYHWCPGCNYTRAK